MFLEKLKVTSNASRNIVKIKSFLSVNTNFSILYYRNLKRKGRSFEGKIVCWTKSSRKRIIRQPKLLKYFNYNGVGFVSNLLIIPFLNKLVGLIFYLTGGYSFLQLPDKVSLFNFLYYKPKSRHLSSFFPKPRFFKLHQLKIMSKVSFLSSLPNKPIQYIKSSGSVGILISINLLNHTVVIKLPSGVKKIFSIYTTVLTGPVSLSIKKKIRNTKSGYWRSFGVKPIVRGVARNPVDHPHGGRTKAIRYPRTPWGKTTKYK